MKTLIDSGNDEQIEKAISEIMKLNNFTEEKAREYFENQIKISFEMRNQMRKIVLKEIHSMAINADIVQIDASIFRAKINDLWVDLLFFSVLNLRNSDISDEDLRKIFIESMLKTDEVKNGIKK